MKAALSNTSKDTVKRDKTPYACCGLSSTRCETTHGTGGSWPTLASPSSSRSSRFYRLELVTHPRLPAVPRVDEAEGLTPACAQFVLKAQGMRPLYGPQTPVGIGPNGPTLVTQPCLVNPTFHSGADEVVHS